MKTNYLIAKSLKKYGVKLNFDQIYKVKIRSTEMIGELKVNNLSSHHQIRLQNLALVKISKIEDPNCVLSLQYNTTIFNV